MIASFCGDSFVADADVEYLEERIKNVMEYLIKDGKIVFISDGYSEFGLLCRKVAEAFKKEYPIAYVPAIEYISPGFKKGHYDVQVRGKVKKQSLSEVKDKCTKYLISKADVIVCYSKISNYNFGKETDDKDVISINL